MSGHTVPGQAPRRQFTRIHAHSCTSNRQMALLESGEEGIFFHKRMCGARGSISGPMSCNCERLAWYTVIPSQQVALQSDQSEKSVMTQSIGQGTTQA